MVTADLTNPIHLPTGIDTANENPVAKSEKIIRQGKGQDIETGLTNIESAIVAWTFSNVTTDTNPGSGNLALNNSAKESATVIRINNQSSFNSARFDEILDDLVAEDKIIVQSRINPGNLAIYEVSSVSGQTGYDNVAVTLLHNYGGQFQNNEILNAKLIFSARPAAGGLPGSQASWLAETASRQLSTTTVANIAPTVTDVLIWLRSEIVQQANINSPGIGVLITEANRQADGTFDRPSGTSTYDADQANAYIYIGITDSDVASLVLAETFLEARRDGELVYSSSLSDLVENPLSTSQFRYWRTTNSEYHYIAGDVLTVVTRSTSETAEYIYNSPEGDFTQNISDLPFSAVDNDFQARVSGTSDNQALSATERAKLNGLLNTSTGTTGQVLTALYKEGEPSVNILDYEKTWDSSGILGSFSEQRVVSVLVNNNVTVTSVSDGGTLGTQIRWLPNFFIYRVTLPLATGTTPVLHTILGDTEIITPSGFDSNYKIVRANVEANLLAAIDQHGTSADLSTLQSKVAALFPLTPDIAILTNWAAIYDPLHGASSVVITSGYSLLIDYRGGATRYESAGITYGTGTGVVTYTGLTQNLHRSFGFEVSGPSDKVLMWIVDGSDEIPFIDITAAGNFRINNFVPAQESSAAITDQFHFLTRTSGTDVVTTAGGSFSGFTITNFPSTSTQRSRFLQVNVDILINGSDTQASHNFDITLPVENTAQSLQTLRESVYLGPLYNNRTVNVTVGYTLRVDGANLAVDLTLEDAPGDVTVRFTNVATVLSYTAQSTVARVDRWLTFGDEFGNYTFSGETELLISVRPEISSITGAYNGILEIVPVAIDSSGSTDQLNDQRIAQPQPLWTDIEVANDIEFRSFVADHYFTHSELASLIANRASRWVYNLARLEATTGHSITEAIDLAAGSTVGGLTIATDSARIWRDSQSFTAAATNVAVNLPTGTTLASFIFVEVTWHTGVGTATDNTNRNYTEIGSMQSIIDMSDAELILGGRGRGADNYGIEVKQPTSSADTVLTMDIVNLNDAGGATLPTGSLITNVRFY